MKNITYLLSVALILVTACTKNLESGTHDPDLMNIVPVLDQTRVSGDSFQEGDKIGVYITRYEQGKPMPLAIGGNYKNNNAISYLAGKWVASPQIWWEEEKYDVFGYYPYNKDIQDVRAMPFRLAEDQSALKTADALGGYEASDLLCAQNKGVTKSASVPLVFSHVMSKLTVNLKKGQDYAGEIPEVAEVYIHNTIIDSRVDLASGSVVKDGSKAPASMRMKKVSKGCYTAIVVPQRIEVRQPLIEIVCNNVSYMVNAMFIFKPHVHHTINVILNSNPEKVKIEIGGEIQGGWTE